GGRPPRPGAAGGPDRAFGSAEPWLPHGPDHEALAVDIQTGDPRSLLNWTRRLIALRHDEPSLAHGSIEVRMAEGDLLVFERRPAEGAPLLCAFNFGTEPVTAPLPPHRILASTGEIDGATLGAHAAFVARLG
uniref:DUF3459 domain-containing protein n=1 Tax=uncultured Sphingomonas sp. TaxID=158754 RepID=UPI0025D2D6C1